MLWGPVAGIAASWPRAGIWGSTWLKQQLTHSQVVEEQEVLQQAVLLFEFALKLVGYIPG